MLCHAYASTEDAENAIERLVAAGVPAAGIQLITGDAVNDSRDAPIGAFAGDPDTQRRGAFGDTDRDTVTSYRSGVRRTQIASHHRLEKILVDAGLDRAIARANVRALHAGRALVLVRGESALDGIAAVIDAPTLRAAA